MNQQKVVTQKIQGYAKGIPEDLREDFAQDMWVMLAELVQEGTYTLVLPIQKSSVWGRPQTP